MTRDEAADTIYDLRKKASGMPTLSCGAMMGEAVFLADVLVALGVLKLDVSLSERLEAIDGGRRRSDPFLALSTIIREQGLEFREVGPFHIEITSPATELQRDLIEDYTPIIFRVDYAPAPSTRCEPPPERTRGNTWHWLVAADVSEPLFWRNGQWWGRWKGSRTPEQMYHQGFRYVAPCLPPEEKP